MIGFMTQSGSVYYVDRVNKLVCGGSLGNNWIPYTNLSAIIGVRGRIVLVNGKIIDTNIVVSYV